MSEHRSAEGARSAANASERSRDEQGKIGDQPPPVSTTTKAASATSLPAEHAVLRKGVTVRAEAVIHEAEQGAWPARKLVALVNYLQLELLRQIADEEWLLFRDARQETDALARLRNQHLELRLGVEALTQAAVRGGQLTPAQLAAATRDLLAHIDAHLTAEETVLAAADTTAPGTASLGSQPHEWYSLLEGPVIDLDRLPGSQGADAALHRLLQLRSGERVQLQASADPSPLWRRLWLADPGGYGVTHLEQGPPRWRVEIVRRPPEPPLSPAAG